MGGKNNSIQAGADFGIRDSEEELLDLVGEAMRTGVPRIKLKFAPGWDLPILRKVRHRFPDTTFHIDCNAGYHSTDVSLFKEVNAPLPLTP